MWPAPSLIAQVVEHCTGIVEDMGSNPVQAWIQALIPQLMSSNKKPPCRKILKVV